MGKPSEHRGFKIGARDAWFLPVLLLAQLVAPPLQPGPVRIPETRVAPEPSTEILVPTDGSEPIQPKQPEEKSVSPGGDWIPAIQGSTPYAPQRLRTILERCQGTPSAETLKRCAAVLTAQLTADGYVNTRVFIQAEPAPGSLEVVEGKLVEIRIRSEVPRLKQIAENELKPLLGEVLNLSVLQQRLVRLRLQPGIGQIQGNMGRLGSDPTQAVLSLNIDPRIGPAWTGELSLRNDGNGGTGQWRNQAVLLKNSFIKEQDTFLLYQEVDYDNDPELGSTISSISYTLPISNTWRVTSSLGFSKRKLVEAPGISHELSFRQVQGLVQLETTLKQNPTSLLTAFVGVNANRNDSFLEGASIPLVLGGGNDGWLKSGYLRAGLNASKQTKNLYWSGLLYGLQGIAGITDGRHLSDLSYFGVNPETARAVGGFASIKIKTSTRTNINLSTGGQWAFNPLLNPMGFSLGSDTGLKGLPGSLISGDSGWLGTIEGVWSVWESRQNRIQLVPFIGMGSVKSTRNEFTFQDSIGSGGLLFRWLRGKHWEVELGWVDQFGDEDNTGFWTDWLIGNGAYGAIKFRF